MATNGGKNEHRLPNGDQISFLERSWPQTKIFSDHELDTRALTKAPSDDRPDDEKSQDKESDAIASILGINIAQRKQKTGQLSSGEHRSSNNCMLSLLMRQGSGEGHATKGQQLSPCHLVNGCDGPPLSQPLKIRASQKPAQKAIQPGNGKNDASRKRTVGPSQLQTLLQMPMEKLKEAGPTNTNNEPEAPKKAQPNFRESLYTQHKNGTSPPQSQPVQQPMPDSDGQFSEKSPAPILDKSGGDPSAYLFPSLQSMFFSAQNNISSQAGSLPLNVNHIKCGPSGKLEENERDDCQSSHGFKKQRLHSYKGDAQMAPCQTDHICESKATPESKQRRFQQTRRALARSGLLGVTMRTAQLMHDNKILEREIMQLQKDTEALVRAEMKQRDPDTLAKRTDVPIS